MKLKDVILLEAEQPKIKVEDGKLVGKYPEVWEGDFDCMGKKLTTLAGAPQRINGDLWLGGNNLETLNGIPKIIAGSVNCDFNKLSSLRGIEKMITHIGGYVSFFRNPIQSHMLGLLLIDGLDEISFLDNESVQDIINKHLRAGRNVFACQAELIEAGFEKFATL